MTGEPLDLLVVSPHLDDAVFSCGGMLHAAARAGGRVLVATVFTADIEPDEAGAFVRTIVHHMGLEPETAMAARREEDRRACGRLGVEWIHLGLSEAPCRAARTDAGYDSYRGLFGEPAAADVEATGAALRDALGRLPTARRWLGPAAFGGHVDHRLVHGTLADLAARADAPGASGVPLQWYEDLPYALRWRVRTRLLGPPWRRTWRALPVALEPADLDARLDASALYPSQVLPIFRSEERMRRRFTAHARRAARGTGASLAERLWSTG